MSPLYLLALQLTAVAAEPATITVIGQPLRSPESNAVLATMRGGLRLPNGLDVAIGIDIQTRIDGVLALHTIYSSEGSNAGIRVYTDGTNSPRVAPGTNVIVGSGQGGAPTVLIARTPSGPIIVPGAPVPPVAVNLVAGAPGTWLNAEGQTLLPIVSGGPAVATPAGGVTLAPTTGGATVTLEAPMLRVQQLVGQATGVVVANTASDRTIDSVSSINVDLGGLSLAGMAGIFAVQRAALDAVRGR